MLSDNTLMQLDQLEYNLNADAMYFKSMCLFELLHHNKIKDCVDLIASIIATPICFFSIPVSQCKELNIPLVLTDGNVLWINEYTINSQTGVAENLTVFFNDICSKNFKHVSFVKDIGVFKNDLISNNNNKNNVVSLMSSFVSSPDALNFIEWVKQALEGNPVQLFVKEEVSSSFLKSLTSECIDCHANTVLGFNQKDISALSYKDIVGSVLFYNNILETFPPFERNSADSRYENREKRKIFNEKRTQNIQDFIATDLVDRLDDEQLDLYIDLASQTYNVFSKEEAVFACKHHQEDPDLLLKNLMLIKERCPINLLKDVLNDLEDSKVCLSSYTIKCIQNAYPHVHSNLLVKPELGFDVRLMRKRYKEDNIAHKDNNQDNQYEGQVVTGRFGSKK